MAKFYDCDRFRVNNISTFILGVTQQCNFRCRYCCFSGDYDGYRMHSPKSMSTGTLERALEFIKGHASADNTIDVGFYGGEALLQFPLIVTATEDLKAYFGDRVTFNISTNGFLLNDDVVDWICSIPGFRVGVSIDGSKSIHDRNRVTAGGSATFDTVVGNLQRFRERHQQEYDERIQLLVTYGSLLDVQMMDREYSLLRPLAGHNAPYISSLLPNFSRNELHFDSLEVKRCFFDDALDKLKRGEEDLSTNLLCQLVKVADKQNDLPLEGTVALHTCFDELYSTFISATGELFPCEHCSEGQMIGNLKDGFDKVRMQKYSRLFALKRNSLCTDCEVRDYCKRCIAHLRNNTSQWRILCGQIREDIALAKEYSGLIGNLNNNN